MSEDLVAKIREMDAELKPKYIGGNPYYTLTQTAKIAGDTPAALNRWCHTPTILMQFRIEVYRDTNGRFYFPPETLIKLANRLEPVKVQIGNE